MLSNDTDFILFLFFPPRPLMDLTKEFYGQCHPSPTLTESEPNTSQSLSVCAGLSVLQGLFSVLSF